MEEAAAKPGDPGIQDCSPDNDSKTNGIKSPNGEVEELEEKTVKSDEDDEENDSQEEDSHLPIDRGWAWMIIIACFINATVVAGYGRALAVLFVEFLQKFKASTTMTSLIYGVLSAVYSCSAFLVLNLLASYIAIRKIIFIGTVLTFTGVLSAAFANDIRTLICLQSIFIGVGHSMIIGPGIVLIGQYFHKRRALAIGLANSGVSFGAITMPALVRYLLDEYGLQGSYIIFAAIQLHLLISVLLSKPLESFEKPKAPLEKAESLDSLQDLHAHLRPLLSRQCSRVSKTRSISATSKDSSNPDVNKVDCVARETSLCSSGNEQHQNETRHGSTRADELARDSVLSMKEQPLEGGSTTPLGVLSEEQGQTNDQSDETASCNSDAELKRMQREDPPEHVTEQKGNVEENTAPKHLVKEESEKDTDRFQSKQKNRTKPNTAFLRQTSEIVSRKRQKEEAEELFRAANSLRKSSISSFSAPDVHRLTKGEERKHTHPSSGKPRKLELVKVEQIRGGCPGTPRRGRKRTTSEMSAKSTTLSELLEALTLASIPRPAYSRETLSASCVDITQPMAAVSMLSLATERDREGEGLQDENISFLGKLRLLGRTLAKAIDFSLLKHPLFLIICAYTVMGIMPSMTLSYTPALAVENGIDEKRAALMLSLVGVIDFFSRLGLGFLANLGLVRTSTLMATGLLLAGTLLHCTVFYNTFPLFVGFTVMFGLVGSSYNLLCTVLIVDLLGKEKNAKALGFVSLLHGMSGAVGNPVVGRLRDITGSYRAAFHFMGTCAYVTSALLFLVTIIKRRMDSRNKSKTNVEMEMDVEAAVPMKADGREITSLSPEPSAAAKGQEAGSDSETEL